MKIIIMLIIVIGMGLPGLTYNVTWQGYDNRDSVNLKTGFNQNQLTTDMEERPGFVKIENNKIQIANGVASWYRFSIMETVKNNKPSELGLYSAVILKNGIALKPDCINEVRKQNSVFCSIVTSFTSQDTIEFGVIKTKGNLNLLGKDKTLFRIETMW